jgi:formylglycine-generating enzyme required for sulfatase activity
MRTLLIALSVFLSSLANAQIVPNLHVSTVQVDKRQVSNQDWNTFLEFMKKDDSFSPADVVNMTPEDWSQVKLSTKNKDQDVKGVSWKQATAYCEWRSELLTYLNTHTRAASYERMVADNKLAKTRITYRLPTGEEYVRLVSAKAEKSKGDVGFRGVYFVKTVTL